MKKGYKKILLIEFILFCILLFNSFIKTFLTGYYMVLFVVFGLVLFRLFFGFEKDRHLDTGSVIKTIIIYFMSALIVYMLLGLFTGYALNTGYYSWNSMSKIVFPIIIVKILVEYFRYQLLQKSEGNRILVILTTMLIILMDVTSTIHNYNFTSVYGILTFAGLNLLPSVSLNAVLTYMCVRSGYKPTIIVNLVISVYMYFLPILSDFSVYIKSIFDLLSPVVLYVIMQRQYKDKLNVDIFNGVISKKFTIRYALLFIFVIILVYFTSGLFTYTAVAVASDSMHPTFDRGAVVIVKKVKNKYEELEIGDIVAYDYEGKIIVHRISDIETISGIKYFYTKGDNNSLQDSYKVDANMIRGEVRAMIPFIGYPTVLLSEIG